MATLVQSSSIISRQKLCIARDHAERLLHVVGDGVRKVFEIGVHTQQGFVGIPKALFSFARLGLDLSSIGRIDAVFDDGPVPEGRACKHCSEPLAAP